MGEQRGERRAVVVVVAEGMEDMGVGDSRGDSRGRVATMQRISELGDRGHSLHTLTATTVKCRSQ